MSMVSSNHNTTDQDLCVLIYTCNEENTQDNFSLCPVLVDGIGTCFFPTKAGETASARCPDLLSEITYNSTQNVTRYCLPNATWEEKSNYTACIPVFQDLNLIGGHFETLKFISYFGTYLSTVALLISFLIFGSLRRIRCWRNIIHWNLTSSFILRNVMWILLHHFVEGHLSHDNYILCRVFDTLFYYSQTTNYFWMLMEGIYLHMMIALAFTHDRIKLKVYLLLGWGVPILFTLIWVAIKITFDQNACWIADTNEMKAIEIYLQVPILLILLVNAIILTNVVRILVKKMRAGYQTGDAPNEVKQYTKAVKATVFLFPLLGLTYVIFFVSPSTDSPGNIIFLYFNTCMQSFQGLFVCSIYCFANKEVQRALKDKLSWWNEWIYYCPCVTRPHRHRRRDTNIMPL